MPHPLDEHEAEEILKEINHLAWKMAHNPPLPLYHHWDDDIDMWVEFLEDNGYHIFKSEFPLSYEVYLPAWRDTKMYMEGRSTSGEYPIASAMLSYTHQPNSWQEPQTRELWTNEGLARMTSLEHDIEDIQFRMLKPAYNHNQEIQRTVLWLSSCSPEQAMDYMRLILSRVKDVFKRFIRNEPH